MRASPLRHGWRRCHAAPQHTQRDQPCLKAGGELLTGQAGEQPESGWSGGGEGVRVRLPSRGRALKRGREVWGDGLLSLEPTINQGTASLAERESKALGWPPRGSPACPASSGQEAAVERDEGGGGLKSCLLSLKDTCIHLSDHLSSRTK